MQVQEAQVQELSQDPDNSRSHDRKNLEAIKQSLEAFGQQKPIVIDQEGKVVAGNGTLQAAQELGWKTIQAVVTDLEGAKQTAYAIADNRTAELAAWNDEQLAKSLVSLQNDDSIDEAISGFDTKEIDKMVQSIVAQNEVVEDEIPQNVEPVTKPGDLWKLGRHRLLCGDSTKAEDVERLMGGEKATMVFTDPPYGMNLDTNWGQAKRDGNPLHSSLAGGRKYRHVEGDHNFDAQLVNAIFQNFQEAKEVFIFGADYFAELIPYRTEGSWIVWDKCTTKDGSTTLDAGQGSNFELCWSKIRHKREIARVVHKGLFSVENDKREHPTQKPVALAIWFFDRFGNGLDSVADLYAGSGSTLLASEKTARQCYGMEIDPAYCDVIIKRWENLTGETAERLEG